MQSMSVDSAVGDIGSQVANIASQALDAGATAATTLTSLMPAGADEVSAQALLAFTTEAGQLLATNQAAQQELMRAGQTLTEIAGRYSEADASAAGSIGNVGLLWGYRPRGG
jgi:hypothetical protein